MSFRPPKPRRRKADSSPPPQSSSAEISTPTSCSTSRSTSPSKLPAVHRHLVPTVTMPKLRRVRNTNSFYLPGPEKILSLPGQSYSQTTLPRRGRVNHSSRHPAAPINDAPEVFDDDPFMASDDGDILNDILVEAAPNSEELQREKQKHKRKKQWKTWTQVVIPSLLRPHLQLLRRSVSLRSVPPHKEHQCECNGTGFRRLKVVCVSFEGAFDSSLL